MLLTAALAWQTRKLTATELELREERAKREALEAQHSKMVLALASKTTEAVRFLASELRALRK